jgi:hypothetical protein
MPATQWANTITSFADAAKGLIEKSGVREHPGLNQLRDPRPGFFDYPALFGT